VRTVSRGYSYDNAGRLATVADTGVTGVCTTRTYAFDADSNRLARRSYPAGAGGACSTNTSPTTVSHAYDTADRLLGNGVDLGLAYDSFGRITTLPGTDTSAGGNTPVTSTYYDDDLVRSMTQGTSTVTFGRDASGRLGSRVDAVGNVQIENHYDSPASDSPSWITEQTANTWTRNLSDLAGNLTAIINQAGAINWQLTNLHGNVVASVTGSSARPDALYTTDEFGNPQTATPGRYSWLGGKQREADTPGGLTLMGVRLYSPTLGRFLSIDPIRGGNANGYDYPADPINASDVTGMSSQSTSDDGGLVCKCNEANSSWHTIYSKWYQSSWDDPSSLNRDISGFTSLAWVYLTRKGPWWVAGASIEHLQARYKYRNDMKRRCHNNLWEYEVTKKTSSTQVQLRFWANVGWGRWSYNQQWRTQWLHAWSIPWMQWRPYFS